MKRILSTALTLSILAIPTSASAQTIPFTETDGLFLLRVNQQVAPALALPVENKKPDPTPPVAPPKPEPVVYTAVSGDNLTKIGTAHNVTWQRLWAKNTQLTHPDQLNIGEKLTIPLADEALSRDIPPAVALPAVTPDVSAPAPSVASRSYAGGNTYDYGYCTWYVKNRRGASLPNGLGNANTWYARARAMGMAVGSTPVAGAVGTTTRGSLGHVVYVDSVNADGSVNISEMNYKGFGVQSSRTTSASEFMYIY